MKEIIAKIYLPNYITGFDVNYVDDDRQHYASFEIIDPAPQQEGGQDIDNNLALPDELARACNLAGVDYRTYMNIAKHYRRPQPEQQTPNGALFDADNLALRAENLLGAINRFAAAEAADQIAKTATSASDLQHAQEEHSECWRSVQSAIYEYRKRAKRYRDAVIAQPERSGLAQEPAAIKQSLTVDKDSLTSGAQERINVAIQALEIEMADPSKGINLTRLYDWLTGEDLTDPIASIVVDIEESAQEAAISGDHQPPDADQTTKLGSDLGEYANDVLTVVGNGGAVFSVDTVRQEALAWIVLWTEKGINCRRAYVNENDALVWAANLAREPNVINGEVVPLYRHPAPAPLGDGWTKEAPIEPGWYWARSNPNNAPQIEQIMKRPGHDYLAICITRGMERRDFIPVVKAGFEWCGPISAPTGGEG